jgi:hypothetical protein
MSRFEVALAVADAVLYEGYLLYPYTASARKNRLRWQFGVVMPRAYANAGYGETAEQQTEVLLEASEGAEVEVVLRFLQLEERRVEAWRGSEFVPVESLDLEGASYLTFEEGIERTVSASLRVYEHAELHVPVEFEASEQVEILRDAAGAVRGRIVRERWPLRASLTIACEAVAGGTFVRLRVRLENDSEIVAGPQREGALRTALISTHTLLGLSGGSFLSILDPPSGALEAVGALANRHTWPVLVGEGGVDEHRSELVLSSPIILYDFPVVAAQTQADACDATEIDELLSLSVLSLPQAERDEARATDPRARAIIERAERFGPEQIARLHLGALQREDAATPNATAMVQHDPFAAIDMPSIDCVFVGEKKVAKGSSVRLHPKRRADVWDSFLVDRVATVRAIHQDFEDQFYVAVTVDDDPASELHEWYGRSFFFSPDEVEPL